MTIDALTCVQTSAGTWSISTSEVDQTDFNNQLRANQGLRMCSVSRNSSASRCRRSPEGGGMLQMDEQGQLDAARDLSSVNATLQWVAAARLEHPQAVCPASAKFHRAGPIRTLQRCRVD